MTFDDLPTLSIAGEGYIQLHVPCLVAIDGGQPISVTRLLVLRPDDCDMLAEKLTKCARLAREIGPEEPPREPA